MLKTSDCAGVQTSIGEGCRRSPKKPTSASRDSCRRRSRGVDTRSYIRGQPVTQTKVRQQVDRKESVQGSSPISQRCEKTQESLGGSASLSVSRVLVQQGSVWGEHGQWRGGCAVHLRRSNTWRIGTDHILAAVFAGSCLGFGVETRGLAKKEGECSWSCQQKRRSRWQQDRSIPVPRWC